MNAYSYLPQERRCDEEGRKSRVKVGIIFEYVDRRQTDSASYIDFEKRSGKDRRSGNDRRRKLRTSEK